MEIIQDSHTGLPMSSPNAAEVQTLGYVIQVDSEMPCGVVGRRSKHSGW